MESSNIKMDVMDRRKQEENIRTGEPVAEGLIPRGLYSSHNEQEMKVAQVSVNKVLQVLTQSLNEKERENKQLKEKCDQLQHKLNSKFIAKSSEEMLLVLKRQSVVAARESKSSASVKTPDSSLKSSSPSRVTENQNQSPLKQKSLDFPRKSHSGKKTVSRAKSVPAQTEKNPLAGTKRSSHPQIFLFPDTCNLTKPSVSGNGTDSNRSSGTLNFSEVSADGDKKEDHEVSYDDVEEFEGLDDGWQEPPGVSTVYFNNVINELMVTKTMLHSLMQQKQKEGAGEMEMERMRNEIQQLRLKNAELQHDRAKKEKDEESAAKNGLRKENSFELIHSDDTEQQRLSEVEILRLKTENEELKGQIRVLKAEKEQLLYQVEAGYNDQLTVLQEEKESLKRNINIVSTCLSEEKHRSRNAEERLRRKTEESKTLSNQIGSLRMKYEELRMEKTALEKENKILKDETSSRDYRYNSRETHFGRSNPSYQTHSGSDRSSSNSGYNIKPNSWDDKLDPKQNNLSGEMKQSNVTSVFKCPRCLQGFPTEARYQRHLDKCIE